MCSKRAREQCRKLAQILGLGSSRVSDNAPVVEVAILVSYERIKSDQPNKVANKVFVMGRKADLDRGAEYLKCEQLLFRLFDS